MQVPHFLSSTFRTRSDTISLVLLICLALATVSFYAYSVPQVYLRIRDAKQLAARQMEAFSQWIANDTNDTWESTDHRDKNGSVAGGSHPGDDWPTKSPLEVCVGSNQTIGEVEDLFCMPRPNYEPDFKNPCWWETVTNTTGGQPLDLPSRELRCLPYFHILCCSKSGTTDLYWRIAQHPDIVPNVGYFGKEQLFWAWLKNGFLGKWNKGPSKPFIDYINGFQSIANYLSNDTMPVKQKTQLVTYLCSLVDGSPLDMWDLRGWILLPQNRGLREPQVMTPHLMRHLYRDPKFIVLMRDPVERLYTAYLFHKMGNNSESFHLAVVKAIAMFDDCLAHAPSRRECYFNGSVIEHLPADVHFNCYAVFIKEWLAVFPWKHFLFMRTEDYSKNLKSSLLEVFRFLDLPLPDKRTMKKMVELPIAHHTQEKDSAGAMLPETRALLRKYVEPCNAELAALLKDEKYLWKDV
ncbi:hypothetical protein C0Q70_06179 [Pomacea canaliculata]|uniref:Sulfotransferase domain-containing protein n=1 Tax=Pomacea canaliculata TaxID=400727 RepID=A0A2T7PN80_POMCA|nr:hypothetical protein C0Q70_06179 [Pomacea canaliculata]